MFYVKTNMGLIPLEDYYEIKAQEFGFDSYEELLEVGLYIDVDFKEIVEK